MEKNARKDNYEQCIKLIDRDEIIALLAELIKVDSSNPPGNEKAVALVDQRKFLEYGIDTGIDDLEGINRANLIASIGDTGQGPNLVYSAHSDVVPATTQNWMHHPFGAELDGDLMYGRGTVDMKSGAAAMIMALCLLKKAGVALSGSITFIHTAGEEVHFAGSEAYVRKYGVDDMDALAISEPSNNRVLVAERGGLWIKFISLGQTAHAGLPEEGFNALLAMMNFFNVFKNYEFPVSSHPLLGNPTLNLTTLHAGTNTNVIPEKCEATVDIRTVPGLSHKRILTDIQNILKEMKKKDGRIQITVEPINDHVAIETHLKDPFVRTAFAAYTQIFQKECEPGGAYYMTDAVSYLKNKKIPMIIFGPGDLSLIHKPDEHVAISQVIEAIKFYVALAINFLKMPS